MEISFINRFQINGLSGQCARAFVSNLSMNKFA